ncbi:endonuclease/exonuclease/phosphatase family protein [Albimonas pacifica]|uniref:Uncharacterized conserved protein YafD, endonuclease/exonuclease/phosphatase (EEP) superfamily n=1 Tax=Albimonas pacifica TaxID=1114924 RepID=A0A1I3FMC6_9RHOB|nr:endonuclease/exonuclease/phosphatase family protein [Albimonas pacifica]SFI12373.1 Uncharacterized conserved protein YafD, endonuclease/exonuclease/phosphatase (EEP) superfamily [Albimonas pacifica]
MRVLLRVVLGLVAVALAGASFLALVETDAWWVRMTDFPRLQYAVALAALLALLAAARPAGRGLRIGLAALALAALGYNLTKIGPYLWGARSETAAVCAPDRRLTVMVANVRLENRHAEPLLAMVRARNPDLLLALETNAWWDARLSPLTQEMPHVVSEITGGHFGMHLFSTLPLEHAEALFPVGQDAPAIRATVRLPSGEAVRFLGLHPRPPHPGQSARGRDAQLMWAALQAREAEAPAVLAGDLNAVPWERSMERAQRIGALLDPRDALGFKPTYDATSWWMRWPLDQVLHQSGARTVAFTVLPGFGSDHYPVLAELCLDEAERTPSRLEDDDLEEAQRTIEAARNQAGGRG